MTYGSIFLGIVTLSTGIILLGFNGPTSSLSECKPFEVNWGMNTPFVQHMVRQIEAENSPVKNELLFDIHNNYIITGNINRTIPISTLRTAKSLSDIIEYYPSIQINDYESVWVKSMYGSEDLSLMSKGDLINSAHQSLFEKSEIGSFYEIVINYKDRTGFTGETEHKRLAYSLTVVPEIEAEFATGRDNLIIYFKEKYNEKWNELDLDKFPSAGIKFTIDEEGQVMDINLNRQSAYPEIDEYMMDLIKKMPAWSPAVDYDGKVCKQDFELIYGTPGC